ncbi:hypothetical protein [Paraglaciecola agarilytica]|uniref:Flagellar hook-associated protein 2 C-terminal domain-containing protein n=1 Tax=Paraglaciecola agarilytica NO2 TaxID=1125747 RepID=A0ABQ0I1U7_9ALTE|nr:hypothetical protein [Paraglaciecola agarilytica]GAC03301.1 hypothetical protein GAGA_0436 [Paraglaciecola agarilytica NO2]|tara:strand:+ start:52365 stop:53213 length:849 start_codon:yes stop_codon:yes gene_type:complete
MSSGLDTAATSFNEMTDKTVLTGEGMAEFYTSSTANITEYSVELLAGLDALVDKIDFSILIKQKSLEAMIDSINTAFFRAYSLTAKVKEILNNDSRYGELSQSQTSLELINESEVRNEYDVANQAYAANLMTYVSQVEELEGDSKENSWSRTFTEGVNDDSFTLSRIAEGHEPLSIDAKSIASKLATVATGRSKVLSILGLAKVLALKKSPSDILNSSTAEMSFSDSTSGLINIDILDSLSQNSKYGVQRELTVSKGIKTKQLNDYLALMRSTNVSLAGKVE